MSQNSHIVFNQNMLSKKLCFMLIAALSFLSVSCDNQFELFADEAEDEALYYTALEALRDDDYDAAIDACAYMSPNYLSKGRAASLCASAYAGRCGFSMITLTEQLEAYAAVASPNPIFKWFINQSRIAASSASQISDCHQAETLLRGIGPASARTDDENSLMVLLAIRKMALIVDETADTNNDGTRDGGFNACSTGSVSDAYATQFGSAFWEFDKSLDQLASIDLFSDLDTASDLVCTALSTLTKDLCGASDPEVLSAAQLKGARSLIKEGFVIGVDQCGGNAALAACNCP